MVAGRSCYILHHGVVFNCSVKYGQTSLDQELMLGPDLTNQIVRILLRFQEGRIAFMTDIEAMFYLLKIERCCQIIEKHY